MLRIARVAAVHPENHSVEIVMVDDGSRHADAQVLAPMAGTDMGWNDMPSPDVPASGNKWDLTQTTARDMLAVVSFIGRRPVVIGFLYPQISQMLFKDQNRRVVRHASDVYSTIDGSGNLEVYHPSGAYLRIATDPAHEDLTGRDVDGKWKITKNTGAQVHIHVAQAGGTASVDIAPNGDIRAQSATKVEVVAADHILLDAPSVHVTGDLQVDGAVNAGGDISSGGNISATGTVHGTNV